MKRTSELNATVEELEALDRIVRDVNKEKNREKLLQIILDGGMGFFPKASTGMFHHWNVRENRFQVRAYRAKGRDRPPLNSFSYDDLVGRYTRTSEQISEHMYIVRQFPKLPAEYGTPKAALAVALVEDEIIKGFLVYVSYSHADSFDRADMKKLERFRGHALTALGKANTINELTTTRKNLVTAAHASGIAENATDILHHIGNTLNSIKTSLYGLQVESDKKGWLPTLLKTTDLLAAHQNEFDQVLGKNRGAALFQVIKNITLTLEKREGHFEQECKRMDCHLREIEAVLLKQREFVLAPVKPELLDLNQVLEDVLAKNLRLGEILKQAGIIDDFQLNSALSYQRHCGVLIAHST